MNSLLNATGLLLMCCGVTACGKGSQGHSPAGGKPQEPGAVLVTARPTPVREAAQKCCDSLVASDFDGFVSYCHPRMIQGMGGKEAMIGLIRKGIGEGVTLTSATVGEPGPVEEHGGWKISVLTQFIELKVPGGKLASKANLIAVSENGGSTWVFLDGSAYHNPQFAKLFPEIGGKLTLPDWGEPVFTPGI